MYYLQSLVRVDGTHGLFVLVIHLHFFNFTREGVWRRMFFIASFRATF